MPLAPAINMMAGSRYPFGRFFIYDVLGQAAGVFTWASLAVAAVGLGLYVWIRRRRLNTGAGARPIVVRTTRARLVRPLAMRATAAAVRRLRYASRLPRQRGSGRRALVGSRQTDDVGGYC